MGKVKSVSVLSAVAMIALHTVSLSECRADEVVNVCDFENSAASKCFMMLCYILQKGRGS